MPESRSTSNYKAAHERPATAQPKARQNGETVSPAANERRKQKFDELLHEGDGEARGTESADDGEAEARPVDGK